MLVVNIIIMAFTCLFASAAPIRPTARGIRIPLTRAGGFLDNRALHVQSAREAEIAFPAFSSAIADQSSPNFNLDSRSAQSVKRAVQGSGNGGNVNLTSWKSNTLWMGDFQIDGQIFKMQFTHGISDIIIPGPDCNSENCQGHTLYRTPPNAANPARVKGFVLAMGVKGEVRNAEVCIGQLCVPTQPVGVARNYPGTLNLKYFKPDGIAGLGFPTMSATNQNRPTLFHQLWLNRRIREPTFAFKMGKYPELLIGYDDPSLHGLMVVLETRSKNKWTIVCETFLVGGIEVFKQTDVVLDIGTDLIQTTQANAAKFYDAIDGSKQDQLNGFWSVPCKSLPKTSLTFAGQAFAFNPTLRTIDKKGSRCYGGVIANTNPQDSRTIVGTVFLKGVFSLYDMEAGRVGLAVMTNG